MIEFVVLKNVFFKKEIQSRMHYCNNAFHLYFTFQIDANSLRIRSFPNTAVEYLFIVGHNNDICKYILNKKDYVKNIIIISCGIPEIYFKKFNAKHIFVSNRNSSKNYFYNGRDWGFNFNITEDELDLYNLNGKDIKEKVNQICKKVI